jgi:hypothetical protein
MMPRMRTLRAALLAALLTGALAAPARADGTIVLSGHIASERPDWVYVPFDVPAGTNRIDVAYDYDRTGGNALDIGLFDADGTALGDEAGFRGWSGGARTSFTVSASDATPGYRPGRIEPGRWNVILGPYTVGAAGIDYRIAVTLHSGPTGPRFTPQPAATRAKGRGPAWYRGDLHLHTVHSDGGFTPRQVVDAAEAAGLDFLVSTEHDTDTANSIWGGVARPDLLIVGGEEVTTRAGHWGAVGLPPGTWIDWRYRPRDGRLERFVRQVHAAGGLAVANHPFAPCKACDWGFSYRPMDAIEVWNGPWDPSDERALRKWDAILRSGRRLPAVGASDAHRPPNVIGLPQTVVRAPALGTGAVLEGLRAGRSYVAENRTVRLRLSARAAGRRVGIGRTLPRRRAKLLLRVTGVPGGRVVVVTNRRSVPVATVSGRRDTISASVARARYVRVEVRRPDGAMAAFTNPIWLGR